MSTNIVWPVIGGTTYPIPATGEVDWPLLSNYLIALAQAQSVTFQKTAIRVVTTTPVTVVSATDCMIVTNLAVAGAVAVNLPAGVTGQYFAIVDGKGDAATNNITITPNGVQTINGAATYVLSRDRAAVMLSFVSGNWSVVAEFTSFSSGNIPRSAIAAGTAGYNVFNNNSTGLLDEEATVAQSRGGFGTNTSAFTGVVKAAAGTFSAATIVNADIDALAAIDATKIADGSVTSTEFQYLGDVTSLIQAQLNTKLSSPVAIADGGTGQTSKTPAFDALSPTTTKGDIIVYNGTDNVRFAAGTDGFSIIASSGTATGLDYANNITNPMNAVGDMLRGGTAGAPTRLAGNITTTKNFLQQTGSGAASAAPVWDVIAALDYPLATTTTRGAVDPYSASGLIASGRWTPTITAPGGAVSGTPTAFSCLYSRVGKIVTCSGRVDVTTTGTGLSLPSNFNMSLPIASNFAASTDLQGSGNRECGTGTPYMGVTIVADTTNDVATFTFNTTVNASNPIRFTFQYEII